MKPYIPILFLLFLIRGSVAEAYDNSCSNNKDPKPCCNGDAGDPIDPATGTAYREVTDLQTFGIAPIKFTRTYTSRATNFNDIYWDFGNRQTWQHNWNYEMRQLSTKTYNQFDIKVRYPDGRETNFKAPDATSNQRIPPANNGDRLYKWSGSTVGYTLVTADGHEFDFWRYLSPSFHLTALRDGKGLSWSFTYGSDSKLQRISNSFGRWIQIERLPVNGVSCISRIYTNDGRQVTYNYSSWTPTGSVVLSTITYPENEQAQYTWVTADPNSSTARPLLETASDPMYPPGGARTRFVYNYNASYQGSFGLVTGTVLEERNLDTNTLIVSLPQGGGAYPQVLEGDGTEITRKFANGLLVETRDGEGRATTYTYSAGGFGFIETMTEPNDSVTHYTRDSAGRILTKTDGLGFTHSYVYNSAGFVLTETDELNRTTTTTRDTSNRPARIDYPDGSYETWTFNPSGQPLTHRSRNGGTELFVYDSSGNMTSQTDPLGNPTRYTYHSNGLRASMIDAHSLTTSYIYNSRGKLLTTTHSDGTANSYQYDSFGNRTAVIDELGHTTTYTYDEYGRVKTVADPLNRTTTTDYGLAPGCSGCGYADVISRVTSPGGKVTTYSYDRSRLRTSQTIAAGTADAATTTYAYDSGKNLTTVNNPRGKVWQFGYDALRRKTSTSDPLGNVTSSSYDAVGNKLSVTRPDGTVTNFAYDNNNRLTQTTDAAGRATQMTYDGAGNLLTIKDARNNTYIYTYDLLKRKLSLTYPDNSIESYTYDPTGNVASYTNRAGQVRTSTYDNSNRESGFTWSEGAPEVTKTYDAAGRILTLNNSTSNLSYTYDTANQLLSETQQMGQNGSPRTTTYTYDAAGNRATIGYPGGDAIVLGYNNRGETVSVTAEGVSANYDYDTGGNRTSTVYGNNTTVAYAYDDANRLLTLDNKSGGSSFAKFDYAYNNANNRTSRSETDGNNPSQTDAYDYDATDQLTRARYNFDAGANSQDRMVNYAYDAAGNRSNVTDGGSSTDYTASNVNQYTTIGPDHPTYDLNGNLTAQATGSYTYDAQNRLTSAASGGSTITFAYDARNRCVSRAIDGVTTFFYYDGWNVIEERNGTDESIARYIHGADIDEMVARVTSSGPVYYHADALGSTVALTGGNGQVLERYLYDVYGAPTIKNPANATIAVSAFGNRFLFTGREYIQDIALYDYRNRFYSPSFGRFLQIDPMRFDAKDVNLYRYVGNRATGLVDPRGLAGTTVVLYWHCTATIKLEPTNANGMCCPESATGEAYSFVEDDRYGDSARHEAETNAAAEVPPSCIAAEDGTVQCDPEMQGFDEGRT
jgi:RHS repeat-associated protein